MEQSVARWLVVQGNRILLGVYARNQLHAWKIVELEHPATWLSGLIFPTKVRAATPEDCRT
jgi:hypothetical protein